MQLSRKKEAEAENIYNHMDDKELFLKIRDEMLYSKTGINLEGLLSGSDKRKFLSDINAYINRIYKISEDRLKRFDDYIIGYIFGFHVLTELMASAEISDIKVLSWDNVRVKRLGKRMGTEVKFWSSEDFKGFVEMIAVKNGVNTGALNAIQTFTDKDSSEDFIFRFNISAGSINSTGEPYLHIRKVPKHKFSLEHLIERSMLTPEVAEYLLERMAEGYLVIGGKNAAGKTYLLNALLDKIPHEESVLVVQENEELFSKVHPDMMFQHIMVRRGDKKVNYSLKELVINGLLMDIDKIVIGEIKGAEALYFITAALAGCSGIATTHSGDAAGVFDKLADYCKWESDYSREEIMKMLSHIKTVVYVEDFQVKQIAVNYGWNEELCSNHIKVVYDTESGVDMI